MENIIIGILILIKIAILIAFLVFFIKAKGFSKKIIITILFVGYLVVEAISIPNFRKCHPSENSREKSCFYNIRIIAGAVEMYNMDHSNMMDTLNLELLQKEGYLKVSLNKPELDCDYYIKEDNSENDVVVCCKRHGNLIEANEKIKKERESLFYKICKPFKEAYETGYFGGIIYFLFIVLIRWLVKKPEDNDEVLEWENVPPPPDSNSEK
jgi:competence protein ComGC